MTIVLAGGSGFIGTQLAKKLLAAGDTVVVVDVRPPSFTHTQLFFIQHDITVDELPFNVLEKTDAVINLVGAPISQKWNETTMRAIYDSRIVSTRHIVESMQGATSRPHILINASAVGYYSEAGDELLTERTPKGAGFLADVVDAWETEAHKAERFGTRVVCVRTASVVGHGGMVKQFVRTGLFGFLLKLSKRDFWQPWIHEEDIINTYLFALQTSTLQGPINAAAPEAVLHSTFMQTLGTVAKKKVWGVVPRFIRKRYGGLFDEITKSQKVSSQLLVDKGFIFAHPTLTEALTDVLKK